ncbi:MAG: hypothetical protein ACJ8GJ_01780 [Vitreoscilla sp.]
MWGSTTPANPMPSLRTSLIAFAATCALGGAGATTVRTGKPAASQPVAAVWATREQLRECLDTEAALKERFGAIEASNVAHEKLFDQVQAESARLEALQSQLDRDSETSVKAFNALVKEHNLHVRQLNEGAADSRPAHDAYNADMSAFNHRCAGQRYRFEDMEAVTRERKKAAAASGSL